ncbi:MAG: hypothetical protein IJV35_03805 [Neisseriaceae bacterium]|nr:hypothetical protein [Neisseriaceae bacterium]
MLEVNKKPQSQDCGFFVEKSRRVGNLLPTVCPIGQIFFRQPERCLCYQRRRQSGGLETHPTAVLLFFRLPETQLDKSCVKLKLYPLNQFAVWH